MASKGKGAAKKAAPTKQTSKTDAPLTPAQLGHHIQPTGDRRKRFRKD